MGHGSRREGQNLSGPEDLARYSLKNVGGRTEQMSLLALSF